jgi:V8-like Glu-specific endopeptidase
MHMPLSVVLDPGHGGTARRGNSTPDGARFGDGRMEKQLNYQLAQRVSALLGGARLTRGENENRALGERIQAAREGNAAAFVSLHTSAGVPSQSSVWVHQRATPHSLQLAEMIRRQLGPAYGNAQVTRGELAVLNPEQHGRGTAACLVEVGCAGTANLESAAAAIARGVRGHFGRLAYGKGATARERGLDNAPAPDVNPTDWAHRMKAFYDGVPDTTIFPFSAICKLLMTFGGQQYQGSGFYIAPDRILTAGHCVKDGSLASQITVVPAMSSLQSPSEPFGRFTISDPASIIPHPNWSGDTSNYQPDHDMGVIKVDPTKQGPPNGQYFGLNFLPQSYPNVSVCGYPAQLFEATDPTPDTNRQHLDTDFIREVSADADMDVVDYNAIMGYGSSGGPVFIAGTEDPVRQQCLQTADAIAINVTRWGASGPSPLFNGGCRITEAKANWIWSV